VSRAAGALALGLALCALPAAGRAQSSNDATFVRQVAAANEQAIRDARLQLRAGSGESVRTYAQSLIDDDSLALVMLRAAARDAHLVVPVDASLPPSPVVARGAAPVLNAVAPDYFRVVIADQRQMLALLQAEASGTGSAALRTWAADELPVVTRQLAQAEVQLAEATQVTHP